MPGNQTAQRGNSAEMPFRTLDKASEKVSCIGWGGFQRGFSYLEEADAIKLFDSAIAASIFRTILEITTRARAKMQMLLAKKQNARARSPRIPVIARRLAASEKCQAGPGG